MQEELYKKEESVHMGGKGVVEGRSVFKYESIVSRYFEIIMNIPVKREKGFHDTLEHQKNWKGRDRTPGTTEDRDK